MKDYTSDNPVFSERIPILETTDTNHADNVNVTTKQLLQNTLSNRRLLNESMGDTGVYSKDVEYHMGDYCMRENVLYKCLKDTSGEWDAECWQKTTALGEVMNLRNSLNALLKMFGTDEEGNLRQLGEAAYAGIAHNFVVEEGKNFVAGADLLQLLKNQVDEQNSASVYKVCILKGKVPSTPQTITLPLPAGWDESSQMIGFRIGSYIYMPYFGKELVNLTIDNSSVNIIFLHVDENWKNKDLFVTLGKAS